MDNIQKQVRRNFTCTKCGNFIQIIGDAFVKAYEGHDTCLPCRPSTPQEKILTEYKMNWIVNLLFVDLDDAGMALVKELTDEIKRSNQRNAKLVHENDELMAENERLKQVLQTISELKYSNLSYHHEDAACMNDIATKALEESK